MGRVGENYAVIYLLKKSLNGSRSQAIFHPAHFLCSLEMTVKAGRNHAVI